MDFDWGDPLKSEILGRALYPKEIKEKTKNFGMIKGYVYIISKKFRAFPNDPERLLMKIGMSDFNTDDGRGEKERKDLSRLQGFRTTLISFKLHRLYQFDERDTDKDRGSALATEQELHKMVVNEFNPPAIRITFDNTKMDGRKDRPTEWFWIKYGDKGMKKILKWIDEQVYTTTNFEPIWATRFTGNPTQENYEYENIKPEEEYPDRPPKITSFEVVSGTVQEKNELSRTSEAVTAKRKTQRQATINRAERQKQLQARNAEILKQEKELEKTKEFWLQVFKKMGRKFYDKNMGARDGREDDGKYPNKIVTAVSKPKKLSNAPAGMFVVHYKPDVTRRELAQMSREDIEFHTDYIPLHEAMNLKSFKNIKEKYKKEFDHFKKKYKYPDIPIEGDEF